MISIAIVDDHPIVRAGLKAVLNSITDMSIVAEGSCGEDALRLVEEFTPDVLVLDLNLPDMNGLEVVHRLNSQKSHTAILILTIHRDNLSVFDLLKCGVLGYVVKDEALETLEIAIRAVARGENWLSPSVATQVVRRVIGHGSRAKEKGERKSGKTRLTPREIEVLSLLAQGFDNSTIARRLVLTTRTVQNHVSSIYSKLETGNRTETALYAIRCGMVPGSLIENGNHEPGHRR